jgi:hypothetical protein
MALSKSGSAKSSAMNLHPGSELNFKQSPQSEPKYKTNTHGRWINKILEPCKIFARSKIRTNFFGESDDPKTYSPSPPPSIHNLVVISETKGQLISIVQICDYCLQIYGNQIHCYLVICTQLLQHPDWQRQCCQLVGFQKGSQCNLT